MVLFALPLAAQSDITFDRDITSAEFSKFSRVVAQAIYATPVQPAGSSGLLRFDIGVAANGVSIDKNAAYWTKAVGNDFSVGSYVGVPRLVISKGLGPASASASYARLGDSDITTWGGSFDIPIIDGGLVKPTIALRGTYSQITGAEVYEQKVYGVEAFIGKGFGPVVPYAGYGRMRSDATGTIPAQGAFPGATLHDQADINRLTTGIRINLVAVKIGVEATQAEERSYAVKVSFGM
jgi:hypothetical protein